MVQQKIVMKVQMKCERHRTNALKIAAVAKGVSKVSIEAEKDELEVIGDGVDSMKLTMSLRKKLGSAIILSVQEVKGKPEEKPAANPIQWTSSYIQYPHYPMRYQAVHDDYSQQANCSIM